MKGYKRARTSDSLKPENISNEEYLSQLKAEQVCSLSCYSE